MQLNAYKYLHSNGHQIATDSTFTLWRSLMLALETGSTVSICYLPQQVNLLNESSNEIGSQQDNDYCGPNTDQPPSTDQPPTSSADQPQCTDQPPSTVQPLTTGADQPQCTVNQPIATNMSLTPCATTNFSPSSRPTSFPFANSSYPGRCLSLYSLCIRYVLYKVNPVFTLCMLFNKY